MTLIDDTAVTPEHDSERTSQTDTDAPARRRSPWRYVKWAAIAVVAGIALMYAAIFFYATVLNDAPDALDSGDLTEALADDAPTAAAGVDAAADAAVEEQPTEPAGEAIAGADGIWTPTDASEFGYRVDEVLSGVNVTAVGRSNQIAGDLTIEGSTAAIDVTVQVADIRSDNGSRDGQFRGRIMDVEQFPTASFVSTSPIEFGEIPAAGEQLTVSAAGDLTLRGVTRPVTFDVTAEFASSATGDRIGVLGSIPIEFDDFDIPEPSIGSVSVRRRGRTRGGRGPRR